MNNITNLTYIKAYKAAKERYIQADHGDLLAMLVYEHENGFTKAKGSISERAEFKAFLDVMRSKAKTEFLRNVLSHVYKMIDLIEVKQTA
jgi:hypothetical protein